MKESIDKLEARIDGLNKKIDQFQFQLQSLPTEARQQAEEMSLNLENKKQMTLSKIERLKQSSGDAYEDIQTGVSMAIDDLKLAFDTAKERFRQ